MDSVFVEYDDTYVAGHKASSITSIESGDHPPSLYSGHADSCSSLCDPDEPLLFEDSLDTGTLFQHPPSISIPLATKDDYDPLSFICHDSQANHPSITDKAPHIPHDRSSTLESKRSTLLSQDERRVHHIASEQKRRQNIRTGFQQLTELIPALKNVPHRKSTILFKTADYIKHTEKRNKLLRDRLRQLQQRAASPHLAQIRRLQKQLLRQQELLQQHNIPPYSHEAIIMPVSDDDVYTQHPLSMVTTTPCLNIPADEEFGQESMVRERLLSCGKLKWKHA